MIQVTELERAQIMRGWSDHVQRGDVCSLLRDVLGPKRWESAFDTWAHARRGTGEAFYSRNAFLEMLKVIDL